MMTVWASPAIHQSGRCGRRFGGPPPQVPRRARRRLRGRPVAQPGDQPWPNPQIFMLGIGYCSGHRSFFDKLGICHLYISFSLFIFDCCRWYDVCTYVTFYQSPYQSSSISSIQQRIHFHRSGQVGQRNGRDTAVAMRFMLWMAAITVLPWNAKQHQHLWVL